MTLLYEAASCKFQIYNQQILSREYIRDIGQIFRFFEEWKFEKFPLVQRANWFYFRQIIFLY